MKWISVKNRLPEHEGHYLTYPFKYSFASYYHKYGRLKGKWTNDINRHEGEDYITHWMPLPEPPK